MKSIPAFRFLWSAGGKLERAQAVAPAHVGRLQQSKGRVNLYLGAIQRCENRAVTRRITPTLSGSSEATRRSAFFQSWPRNRIFSTIAQITISHPRTLPPSRHRAP